MIHVMPMTYLALRSMCHCNLGDSHTHSPHSHHNYRARNTLYYIRCCSNMSGNRYTPYFPRLVPRAGRYRCKQGPCSLCHSWYSGVGHSEGYRNPDHCSWVPQGSQALRSRHLIMEHVHHKCFTHLHCI